METHTNLCIVFEDSDEPINLTELADFLYLFRAIYGIATKLFPDQDFQEVFDKEFFHQENLFEHFEKYLSELDNAAKSEFFSLDIGSYDLSIKSIKKESPFEIIFYGLSIAMAAAVILSGGEIQIPFTKVKLNPIGYGIRVLREALQIPPEFNTGFTIKPKEIQLNDGEFEELFSYDPAEYHKGGFQKFFAQLQLKTDSKSKIVSLNDNDIEFILKHGRVPKSGGWQKSIRRIFDRHFYFKE